MVMGEKKVGNAGKRDYDYQINKINYYYCLVCHDDKESQQVITSASAIEQCTAMQPTSYLRFVFVEIPEGRRIKFVNVQ